MPKKGLSKIDEIGFWIDSNTGRIMVFIVVIFIFLYGYFSQSNRHVDFQEYTTEVELVNFDYKKSYTLPEFYSTKQKLDKIIFDLIYFHEGKKYKSKTIVWKEHITPQFEKIIENKKMDMLIIKCKMDAPEDVMIFVKK